MLLDGGRTVISTDSITFSSEFNYGSNDAFLKVFVLSYVKLLCDSPLESTSARPKRAYLKFLKLLCTENLGSLIKRFSGIGDEILSKEYVTGGEESKPFLTIMKDTPIFPEYLSWYRYRKPEMLKFILTFLRFGKKLEYEDPTLNAIAFRDWQLVEDRLRDLKFNTNDLISLRNICSVILRPLEIDSLLPKFGGGKVSERNIAHVYDKLSKLGIHPRLGYAFRKDLLMNRSYDKGFHQRWWSTHSSAHDVALLKFVPKDINKSRSICMEPNAFMFFQQEVWRWMRQTMDKSLIARFVNFADQTLSREAAVHGSQYLSTDTIDLSSASDSVSAELVRSVFPKDWLYYLLATRTSRVKCPDGSVREVKKFAPMGSACCFPVQCIIFTCVCLYGYHAVMTGKTTGTYIVQPDDVVQLLDNIYRVRSAQTPFRKKFEAPVVYGDDLAVDSRTTDVIITLLDRLGFSVNVGKSFTGARSFRESCGVYAYEGHDVTPVLYRLPFFRKGGWDAKVYASIIGGINNCHANGYHHLASFWLSLLREAGFNQIPFVTNPLAFGVYTLNKHVPPDSRLRWNADWQIYEERVLGIGPRIPKIKEPERLDDYRLDQWWRSRVSQVETHHENEGLRIRPQETRLVPHWARYE